MANPLVRQLRKEVVANPKKALILGGLLVLALWFWAPLVSSWVSGDDRPDETVAAAAEDAAVESAQTPASAGPATAQPKTATTSWRQIVQWMQADPRTKPATLPADFRDPFALAVVDAAAEEVVPEEETEATQQEITPESLGMVLSSTIVGARGGTASIGGKSYRQGTAVQWSKDGQQFEFVVAEVHPRHIVLLHEGRQFDLRIPDRGRSERIELRPAGN